MRFLAICFVALVVAAPAAAAEPRFGVYDLSVDVAPASHNDFGDIRVASSKASLARRAHGATLVRCGSDCRLGVGWIAFARPSQLRAGDIRSAVAGKSSFGWAVTVQLSARGVSAWAAVRRAALAREKRKGVPDVFAVVLDGTIHALPYAAAVHEQGRSLELGGFTRAGARAAAKLLG